jgi:hypothetical protein
LPSQKIFRFGDVGAALLWVVFGQGAKDDRASAARHLFDEMGELQNGHLFGVAEVENPCQFIGAFWRRPSHHPHHALYQIVHIAKTAGL